jgi:DmsE family decaheme c-type cytochrome
MILPRLIRAATVRERSAELHPTLPGRSRAARRPALLAAAMLCCVSGAGAQPAQPAQPAYVGSQTCQPCHEDIYNALLKSPHQLVESGKKRGWEGKACEACHGPGNKHAESVSASDIRQPAKLPPGEADRICLTCHQNQPTHVGRLTSSHAKNEVSCVTCHTIHKNGPMGLVERRPAAINQQCTGCHTNVWASFQREYRHRLPEGAMSCVDCHNPHGSIIVVAQQRTFRGNEPGCFNCHGDKAAPFVYEHPPVRLEGCMACHEPHGSANPRMLTRAQVEFVCLECHANLPAPPPNQAAGPLGTVPPSFHDLRLPRFANCTTCHQKVHGSYVNSALLR